MALPATWKSALSRGELWQAMPDAHATSSPLGDGSGVLLETDSGTGSARAAHMAIVGRGHRVVRALGTFPATANGQISFTAATTDAVAFVYNPSNDAVGAWMWRLYLWTRDSGRLIQVATNPVDARGQPLHGGYVTPTLTSHYLYWITASPDISGGWGGSSLMQSDLTTGVTRTLYRGLTEAFVPYNGRVLFTAIVPGTPPPGADTTSNGPPEQMDAVDETTGRPVPGPVGITAATDVANNIITDGDMIIWNTWEGGLRAWKPAWGRSITLVPNIDSTWPEIQKLGLSDATYPRLYGHFLVFNPSVDYVLDLDTNSFARLGDTPESEDVTGPWLSISAYASQNSYNRATNVGTYNQYLLNLSQLPGLPGCS